MSFVPVRLISLLATWAMALGLVSPLRGQDVLDGIAAVVGNDVITFSQVRELVGAKELAARQAYGNGAELQQFVKEIRTAAINDLIDRQVILTAFKSRNLQIPDYFIDERINTIIREDFGGDRSAFVRTLAAQGLTLDRYRQLEKERTIVVEMRRAAIKGNVNVSDEQVARYYKQHLEAYGSPEQLKLRTITIRQNGNKARRQMIDEIREKIAGGADFGELARMYSMDDKQEAHGDWGWIDQQTLNESLSKAAFALKAGEMSKVIEVDGSYYLLFAEAKKPTTVKPLKDVRGEIEKSLIQAERQKMQADWIAKLREKSYIRIF